MENVDVLTVVKENIVNVIKGLILIIIKDVQNVPQIIAWLVINMMLVLIVIVGMDYQEKNVLNAYKINARNAQINLIVYSVKVDIIQYQVVALMKKKIAF